MPAFRYKATNRTKKIFTGVVEAESLDDARRRIESRGLKPLEVQPAVLKKPRRLMEAVPRRQVWPWVVAGLVGLVSAAVVAYLRMNG